MSSTNRGFTILEAVVALAIVGLSGVAALEAVGGETRSIERAREAYTLSALAQQRLAVVTILAADDLNPIPDSLARGTFPEPFKDYRWTTKLEPILGQRDLYDAVVLVTGARSDYSVTARLYRPKPNQVVQ
jgi:prepilin-type N-terminal cleavage/methylation domain-containing protein